MKKSLLFFLLLVLAQLAFAQIKDPVKWSFTSKKVNATTYEVHLTATIEQNWHLYSQTTPDGGPVPTSISFSKNLLAVPNGEAKEIGKMEKHFEELFGVDVIQYSNKVDFVQMVTVKPGVKTSVTGTIEYMTCNDHECLPPKKQSFSIALK